MIKISNYQIKGDAELGVPISSSAGDHAPSTLTYILKMVEIECDFVVLKPLNITGMQLSHEFGIFENYMIDSIGDGKITLKQLPNDGLHETLHTNKIPTTGFKFLLGKFFKKYRFRNEVIIKKVRVYETCKLSDFCEAVPLISSSLIPFLTGKVGIS